MPVRALLFSLCLANALPAAVIQPPPADPWAALRSAPLPEALPDPPDYPVPNLTLELDHLLQFVLDWAHPGLEDATESGAVLAALLPQYQAFLNSRIATPPLPPSLPPQSISQLSTLGSAMLLVQPWELTTGLAPGLSPTPEPCTWLLFAAGLAVLLRRPLCRRG